MLHAAEYAVLASSVHQVRPQGDERSGRSPRQLRDLTAEARVAHALHKSRAMQHTTWPVVPVLEPITFELLIDVAGGCHKQPQPCPPPPPPAPAPVQVQQTQIVNNYAAPQFYPMFYPVPQVMAQQSRPSAETTVEVGTTASMSG
jgi:hypothetical protein